MESFFMKLSAYSIPTRKEVPADAEITSHQVMLRAGMIRQHVAGVYDHLPIGWTTLKNIMRVVREEMDRIGCLEFYLPALSSRDLWETSGRWAAYGDDMFRLKDRKGRELCLAPTHEEVFTEIAAGTIQSYRSLPQMWYQIQTKFRDEVRPRSGVLRVRQFFMKDAYSFDADKAGLDKSYQLQREAYLRIYERCGLDVRVVRASSGAMGGGDCEEFMVLSNAGDDEIVNCPACGYASNQEVAVSMVEPAEGAPGALTEVATPEQRTIEEVSAFLGIAPKFLIKSLLYISENGPVFVLVRGDHQVDEAKLEAAVGACHPAEPEEVHSVTGADIGFISPIGVSGVRVIADNTLKDLVGMISGANRTGYHFTGVDINRDMTITEYLPLRMVNAGEPCIKCGNPLAVSRAIEVGHIFKLGTRYSVALGANYLDDAGVQHPIIMGSYGIGIERIMACAIETHYGEKGMVWPREIAPFLVELLPLNVTHEPSSALAADLYKKLRDAGISVLLDDRDERAGVKFNDAELYGAPVFVIIGERGLKEGIAELRVRDKGIEEKVPVENLGERLMAEFRK
jgi:prolyl-tRNA synthetase